MDLLGVQFCEFWCVCRSVQRTAARVVPSPPKRPHTTPRSPPGDHCSVLHHHRLPLHKCRINGLIWSVFFWGWLLSPCTPPLRCTCLHDSIARPFLLLSSAVPSQLVNPSACCRMPGCFHCSVIVYRSAKTFLYRCARELQWSLLCGTNPGVGMLGQVVCL